jgi:NAD(P)-dependent dehydrogenase (short-subunit alcohol dehydrogenase family)
MKAALIIGGSTGIGLDIAKRLGPRGAAATITGRDTSKLDKAAAGIKQAGSPWLPPRPWICMIAPKWTALPQSFPLERRLIWLYDFRELQLMIAYQQLHEPSKFKGN